MSDESRIAEALVRVESMSQDIAEIKEATRKMADAITRLAVMEAHQQNDRAEIGRIFKRLDRIDERLGSLEQAQPIQKQAADWVGKAVWAVVSAVLAAGTSLVIYTKSGTPAEAKTPPVITAPR